MNELAEARSLQVESEGHRIAAIDTGDGPLVIFLHGLSLHAGMWVPQIDALASGFRCVAPDLPGFGESDPPAESVVMEDFARVVDAVIDAVSPDDPVVVVGLSFGGYLALHYARHRSDRIRALVLVATRADPDSPESADGRKAELKRLAMPDAEVLPETRRRQLVARLTPVLRPGTMTAVDEALDYSLVGAVAAHQAMGSRIDTIDVLESLTVPVLVIAGSEDAVIPTKQSEEMAAAAHHSELVLIPGAGHLVSIEAPTGVNRALLSFLERLDDDA